MKNKSAWEIILGQATEVATEVFNRLDIPAGSYTAADVHKALSKKWGRYLQKDRPNVTEEYKYEFRMHYYHKFQSDGLTVTVLTPHIFYEVMNFEKIAGIKAKDKHVWVKESRYTKIASVHMNFPSKQISGNLPAMMNGICKRNSECMVFMPSHSKLLGINSDYIVFHYECEIAETRQLPDVAFKFKAAIMKNIYGCCKVDFYQDMKGRYSLVITNEDGWMTSFDTCLTDNEFKSISRKCNEPVSGAPAFNMKRYEYDYDTNSTSVTKPNTRSGLVVCPDDTEEELTDGTTSMSGENQNLPISPTETRDSYPLPEPDYENICEDGDKLCEPIIEQRADAPTVPDKGQKERPAYYPMKQRAIRRPPKKQRFLKPKILHIKSRKYIEHSVRKLHKSR